MRALFTCLCLLATQPVLAKAVPVCGSMLLPLVEFTRESQLFHGPHHGLDLVAPNGSPIMAAQDGIVGYIGWLGPYGRTVEISHEEGMITRYGHLRAWAPGLKTGQPIGLGEIIGQVGASGQATGPHLHFEVRIDDQPVDPARYLGLRCK